MANKPALLTIGKTLNGDQLFVMSVYDLEPSGIIVQAYSQVDSKEYSLAVSEKELIESKLDRGPEALAHLLETTYLSSHDTNSLALQSTLPAIKVRKKRPAGSDVDKFIKVQQVYPYSVCLPDFLSSISPLIVYTGAWTGLVLFSNDCSTRLLAVRVVRTNQSTKFC